jgi:hypothetical protein
VETDKKGKHFIVPASTYPAIDSIHECQLAAAEASDDSVVNFSLSGFGYGKYRVFTVSNDTVVSNIPEEFCVVPDKSPPVLNLVDDIVRQDEAIRVSISRNGKICLHIVPFLSLDTLHSDSEIINSSRLIASADAMAGDEVCFSTVGLAPKPYWIYGVDQYGIVAGPVTVIVKDSTDTSVNRVDHTPEFELYPNPADDHITVHVNRPGIYEIKITGLNGQLRYSNCLEGTTHWINLSSFRQGVYIISIRSDNSVATGKMIKL